MAMAFSQEVILSKIDLLAKRRDYLSEQRDHLQILIDEASEVIQVATSWIADGEGANKLTFTEISRMTEDKLVHLCATDFSVVCDKPKQQSATSQPLAVRNDKVAVVPDDLERIMTQMKEMQTSISILSTSTEKISEKQLCTDEHIESLSNKYFKTLQQRLDDFEMKLQNISENQRGTEEQQNIRMKSVEKKIKQVENEQSDIVEGLGQQLRKIKEQKKECKTQSQKFTQDFDQLAEDVGELSVICHLNNNSSISSQLEDLENKVKNLETSSIDLAVKFEEQVSTIEEVTRKTEETLGGLTSDSESRSEKLKKFEEKLSDLELNLSKVSPESEKIINHLESKFDKLGISVNSRLAPLEKLRNIFNANLNKRSRNMERVNFS